VVLAGEMNLTERHLLVAAKCVGVRGKIRIELLFRRLGRSGTFRYELEFLLEPAAHDVVVTVKPHRHGLAIVNFFSDVIADQAFKFVGGRRALPDPREGRGHACDAALAYDDGARFERWRPRNRLVKNKERRAQQEEVKQWLPEKASHLGGVYQIGDV